MKMKQYNLYVCEKLVEYLTPGRFYPEESFPESNVIEFWGWRASKPRIAWIDGKPEERFDKEYFLETLVRYDTREQAKQILENLRRDTSIEFPVPEVL